MISRNTLYKVSVAILSGLVAGLIAGLLDARQAAVEISGIRDSLLVLLQTVGRTTLAGALLSGLAFGAFTVGQNATQRLGQNKINGGNLAVSILAAPGLIYVAVRLFDGGVTSQLPAKSLLIVVTASVLTVLFWLGAKLVVAFVSMSDKNSRSRRMLFILCSFVFLLSLGLRWCDAHLYRRLYLFLHGLLTLGTLGGFAVCARTLFFNHRQNINFIRVAAFGLAAALLLSAAAGVFADERQLVKVAVFDQTATTANILRWITGPRKVGSDSRPSAEVRRQRYEREKLARLASNDTDLQSYPGAHLVLITVDALRPDKLGAYGYKKRNLSPNLDKWFKSATLFERAYCTAPHSSYSISSLHTSHFTHDEAMLGKEITHRTLAELLSDAGYETTALYTQGIFYTEGDKVGHYRNNEFGFKNPFHGAPRPEKVTDLAIGEMDGYVARGEPAFFTWIHYFNVHEPYMSTEFGNSPLDRYEGEIKNADKAIMRLLEYIETKLARDTIIVFSADHGEEFEEHGGHYHGSSLFDEQTRVPLIIKVPGAKPSRISTPVSLVDVAPTVLRLLGLKPLPDMTGQDLRPAIFKGTSAHVAKPVFASVMKKHMALKWPWKLISDSANNLFELYNLEQDPLEKVNIYDDNKQLGEELFAETNSWLDELARDKDEVQTALNLGRMRDKRAILGLLAVAANTGAPLDDRVEALDLLGKIRPWNAASQLIELLDDKEDRVAIFAALVLATIDNDKGSAVLRDALYDDDPDVRDKAALALAGLGDTAAVPVLIEALGRDNLKIREDAIRSLGDLRDTRATEPLIETIAEDRTRYLTVLALGKIGDRRANDTLMDVLKHETHTDIRGYAVVAFGWIGKPGPLERILRVYREEPELKWSTEALIRLGAIEENLIFGTDAVKGQTALGNDFKKCTEKDLIIAGEFMGRTVCETKDSKATLTFFADAPYGAQIVIRARHLLADKTRKQQIIILLDDTKAAEVEIGSKMAEFRLPTPGTLWKKGVHTVTLKTNDGRFALDHLLVIPNKK